MSSSMGKNKDIQSIKRNSNKAAISERNWRKKYRYKLIRKLSKHIDYFPNYKQSNHYG
jgi:hypothetical protein